MADIFSLGIEETGSSLNQQNIYINSETQILNYINNSNTIGEEMHPKTSIEIWQSYVQVPPKLQLIHQQQEQEHLFLSGESAPSIAVGPSSTTLFSIDDNNTVICRPRPRPRGMNQNSSGSRQLSSEGVVSGMNCQDCGNQAKKDCAYFRCRTCCKIKGFHCPTHVKSTWVPAAKRRERQQKLAIANLQQQHNPPILPSAAVGIIAQSGSTSGDEKRTPQYQTNSSGLEMNSNFPWELNKAATFRCVKVSPMEDEEEQIAYQTAVNINGHIFKGLLYDQGPQQAAEHGFILTTNASLLDPITPNTSSATTLIYPTPINAFPPGPQHLE